MLHRIASLLPALGLAFAAAALPASAADETSDEPTPRAAEDCPTWFPDFRCERHGRPEGFIPPGSAPYVFEDPFITTGVSAYYLWHAFPETGPRGGGHVNVVALQARIALTDRLALIATRDGYAWMDPDLDILKKTAGPMDLGLGLKYQLVSMPEHDFYLAPSLRFDIPAGDRDVFQGNGDGTVMPGLSAAWGVFDRVHFLGNGGVQIPFDGDAQVTMLFGNFQMDLVVLDWLVPFTGVNVYHYLSNGDGELPLETDMGSVSLGDATRLLNGDWVNGSDYGNFGNENTKGHTTATLAVGLRIPIGRHVSLGGAYEIPFTSQQDVFHKRVTTNLQLEF